MTKLNSNSKCARRTRKQTLNLNEKCNEWLKSQVMNHLEEDPGNIDLIIFDLKQFKKDTICMVDTLACQLQCKAHLQKTADVLCLSRRSVYAYSKKITLIDDCAKFAHLCTYKAVPLHRHSEMSGGVFA